ncbi:MAG TPA: hypothetical protein VGH54_09690 [Mycobacterium sp.]|jgi:transposase-like protein|uniref:hypothetical protein n=1 Tax=Mycobacterium sp. TaxID=1785 RepID=UPI002F40F502
MTLPVEKGRPSTLPPITDLAARIRDGYNVDAICQDHGVARATLQNRFTSAGYVLETGEPRKADKPEREPLPAGHIGAGGQHVGGGDYQGLPTAPVRYRGHKQQIGIDWGKIRENYIANDGIVDDSVWTDSSRVEMIRGTAATSRRAVHTFELATDYREHDEPTPAFPARGPRPKLINSKIRSEQRIVVARRYQDGESVLKIARDYGVAPKTVYGALRMAGVEIRDRSESLAGRGKLAGKREEIGQRYLAGESMSTLAKAYGVALTAIQKTILKQGIQPRRQGRSS